MAIIAVRENVIFAKNLFMEQLLLNVKQQVEFIKLEGTDSTFSTKICHLRSLLPQLSKTRGLINCLLETASY